MRKVIVGAMVSMDGVKTATVGGEVEPSATELARRERLKREG